MGVPKAVPSAIAPSTGNSVKILKDPQLGPYEPMTGSSINPVVPRTEGDNPDDARSQPGFLDAAGQGMQPNGGSEGAPSVPGMGGALFTSGPIDQHYTSESEAYNPYFKVNNPPTRGMLTWVKAFINGIAMSQNKTADGFNVRAPQQRTSYMRITPPPHADGYSPETYTPRQLPQSPATYKFNPSTGTDKYGTGVLNSETFGAGQTAGGQGGNNYTPTPGPPATNSTADQSGGASGMPTWG